jgi:hypothetical protein
MRKSVTFVSEVLSGLSVFFRVMKIPWRGELWQATLLLPRNKSQPRENLGQSHFPKVSVLVR